MAFDGEVSGYLPLLKLILSIKLLNLSIPSNLGMLGGIKSFFKLTIPHEKRSIAKVRQI
jgi:hypothetical protein